MSLHPTPRILTATAVAALLGERQLLLGPDWRVSADGACRAELAGLTGTFRLVA